MMGITNNEPSPAHNPGKVSKLARAARQSFYPFNTADTLYVRRTLWRKKDMVLFGLTLLSLYIYV